MTTSNNNTNYKFTLPDMRALHNEIGIPFSGWTHAHRAQWNEMVIKSLNIMTEPIIEALLFEEELEAEDEEGAEFKSEEEKKDAQATVQIIQSRLREVYQQGMTAGECKNVLVQRLIEEQDRLPRWQEFLACVAHIVANRTEFTSFDKRVADEGIENLAAAGFGWLSLWGLAAEEKAEEIPQELLGGEGDDPLEYAVTGV